MEATRLMVYYFTLFIFVFQFTNEADAANWAQASGNIQQNTVIPYYPAPGKPHWGPRYGHAATVRPTANLSDFSSLFLFGGDTYSNDFSRKDQSPGLLDSRWETGYKNDVWKMVGTEWYVQGDMRLRTEYHRKIPRIESRLKWQQVAAGLHPPRGTTYDKWISCANYFQNKNPTKCTTSPAIMWSPRRHHAAIFFKEKLWILGGRAREFIDFGEYRTVGGVIGPRVQDIPDIQANRMQLFSTQREASVYKSDVWSSDDGFTWELVTPGCKAPQRDLVASGNPKDAQFGTFSNKCTKDADCYGAEVCDKEYKTCVCSMWSPREQHQVAAYAGTLFVVGGYASRLYSQFSNCGPYACGDTDAAAYRYYLSDVWKSTDGDKWTLVTASAFQPEPRPGGVVMPPLGRGGHQMVVVDRSLNGGTGQAELWVIGGRGGDNTYLGGDEVYFNDVWIAPLNNSNPITWTPYRTIDRNTGMMTDTMPWLPRTGHGVALEEASSENLYQRTLYLYGGYNNGTTYDDVWTLRVDDPREFWRQDFTPDAYFGTGDGDSFHFSNSSPTVDYIKPDSDLSYLQRFWIPTKVDEKTGKRMEKREYLSDADIKIMNDVGLKTVRDLADIDLYTLLKLRGFDYPQVQKEDRYTMYQICDYRALARALVEKCSLTLPSFYNGENQMPWNVVPEFGGNPPFEDKVKWHGRKNYNFLLPGVDDPDVLTDQWDGCAYVPQIQGLFGPNINGLGYVDQVTSVRDPHPELQNLNCRQDPGARAWHVLIAFEGRIYAMGGKKDSEHFYADTWYRDAKLPQAKVSKFPVSNTPDDIFLLVSDKAGSHFEYRVWDPYNYIEVRGWTKVTKKAGVNWLNWRKGGPGSGLYQIYFRAVDPAGNMDERFILNRNVYIWYYVSPTPWDIIFSVVGAFIGLCILAYLEYRRRVKKAAMERYAMKRMRRKFKAMQRDIDGKAVDWRTLYMESKQADEAQGKNKKKKLKKVKDKNAEKREKEKQKREKEKELIKKKLKATKEMKTKKKTIKIEPAPEDVENQSVDAKSVTKKGAKGKGAKVTNGEDEFDDLFEESKTDGPKSKAADKAKAGKGAVVPSEIGAGDLEASKNTETGFKQRKVNKRFKSYEEKDGDDQEGPKDK